MSGNAHRGPATFATINLPQCMQAQRLTINAETISFYDAGAGQATLLFLHGAFIHKEYWLAQLDYFAGRYRVVAPDLAGHGASSHDRTEWSPEAYGRDIQGLIQALDLRNVILVGHSFGADVMLETVTLDPARIIGLIDVDHFKAVDSPPPAELIDQLVAGLRADFAATAASFARQALLSTNTDAQLAQRLFADYTRMNHRVGINIFENIPDYAARKAILLNGLTRKLYLLHVDYSPTDVAALRQHMGNQCELHSVEGTSHYPMIEDAAGFNRELTSVVEQIML